MESEPDRPRPKAVSLRALEPLAAAREVARQSLRDDIVGLSAELAFRFFLALFPFFISVTALGGLLAAELRIENPARQVVELLGDVLPPDGAGFLEAQLEQTIENASGQQLLFGVVLAIVFGTGGTNALIKALNRAYGVKEHRPVWKRYLLAMTLTISAGAGTVAAFLLFVPLRFFAPALAEGLDLGEHGPLLISVTAVLAALALLVLAVMLLFRLGPSIKLPLRVVLPGATLFALSWLAATFLFGFYVWDFANYANTYGALAGVVIVLVWFYILALLLLVSAEINQVLHEMTDPHDVALRRSEAEAEGRADWRPTRDLGLPGAKDDDSERGASAG